jgi:hypothetical protein
MTSLTLKSKKYEAMDIDEFTEMAYREGWTDGLPVLPPTEKAVMAIVDYLGRDPAEVVGVLSSAEGIASIEKIAINCAMAGCKPAYVPIVITAIEAMLADEFEHMRVNATTGGPAPAAIISGPVVKQLGFNYAEGALSGSGNRVNSTIGRAIRLVLWNIAQSRPGAMSGSTYGHIGRYSYLLAERPPDDGNPWEPFHVTAADLSPDDSAVTMFPCGTQEQISTGLGGNTLEDQVDIIADCMSLGGTQKLVVLNPHLANAFADAGWSKRDLRDAIMKRANPPAGLYGVENLAQRLGEVYEADQQVYDGAHAGDDFSTKKQYSGQLTLPSATGPRPVKEELHILVTGGWPAGSGDCLRFNSMHGQLVTRKIDWNWQ